MREELKKIQDIIAKSDFSEGVPYSPIYCNYNINKCYLLAINSPEDIETYCETAAIALLHYFGRPTNSINIAIIAAFYETYKMFGESFILMSDYDKTKEIYDSSTESKLARVIAIGMKTHYDFTSKIIEILEGL